MSARANLLRKSCRAPADNHFIYVSLPGFDRAIPRGHHTRKVVGMNNAAVGPTFQLVKRFSKVIQLLLIDEFDVAVRRQSNNMSRNAIED
jgi:hypothetical protein